MNTTEILSFLEKEIHSVIIATVDEQGLPITCAVDMMDSDAQGLYFLTARGKGFYRRLKEKSYVSLTGMKGDDTLSCVAVSLRGKVKEIGSGRLDALFEKNPYMEKIYPTAASRSALTVFQLYEGEGEWFDLSKHPIERASFVIGEGSKPQQGYRITERCNGCRACEPVCPQGCIDFSGIPAIIKEEHCLHCGNCMSVCPQSAVIRSENA